VSLLKLQKMNSKWPKHIQKYCKMPSHTSRDGNKICRHVRATIGFCWIIESEKAVLEEPPGGRSKLMKSNLNSGILIPQHRVKILAKLVRTFPAIGQAQLLRDMN
jgi:hypothetical protein